MMSSSIRRKVWSWGEKAGGRPRGSVGPSLLPVTALLLRQLLGCEDPSLCRETLASYAATWAHASQLAE